MRQTLTDTAILAEAKAKTILKEEFVLRNNYTLNSVRMTKASTQRLESRVGSLQSYLDKQEQGGTKQGTDGAGANIATKASTGEGSGSGLRKGVVMPRNRMKKIQRLNPIALTNPDGTHFKSKKQAAFVAYKMLAKQRTPVVLDGLHMRFGAYAVINDKLQMVQDLSHYTIRVSRHQWLWPASLFAANNIERLYRVNIQRELDRVIK